MRTIPYAFVATAEAIQYLAATPVFVDVREEDSNLDPERVYEVMRDWEVERERVEDETYGVGREASGREIRRKGAGDAVPIANSQFLISGFSSAETLTFSQGVSFFV